MEENKQDYDPNLGLNSDMEDESEEVGKTTSKYFYLLV